MLFELMVGGFQGCSWDEQRNDWRYARAVRKRPLDAGRTGQTFPPGDHDCLEAPARNFTGGLTLAPLESIDRTMLHGGQGAASGQPCSVCTARRMQTKDKEHVLWKCSAQRGARESCLIKVMMVVQGLLQEFMRGREKQT